MEIKILVDSSWILHWKRELSCDEAFSPVVGHESLRFLIATAVCRGLQLHQMHVTTAIFLKEFKEEVLVVQPEGL